jgi:3-phenylpropionate/cinnamic acid dioxygenase small subunit
MVDGSLAARLTRIEDRLDIEQLPVRYAQAVDDRDVDAWLALFVPDIQLGRHGAGREALRAFITPQLRWFYRSIHQIVGHRVELLGADSARGQVYCRAEHEVGERWIVMAIRYDDEYRKVDGEWLFSRRREQHWYAADVNERPQSVAFDSWGTTPGGPSLPQSAVTWAHFWEELDCADVTSQPAHPRTRFSA